MSIAFGSSACRECPSAIHYVTRDGSESGVLIWDAHSPAWRPSAGLSEDSPQEYSVTLAPASVLTGGTLTIGWSAPAGRAATDWVGLFSPGDTVEVWWVYTGGTTSGTVALQAPSTSGSYEARYLFEDGYFAAATSPPVTVGSGQPPSLPPANYGVTLTPSSVAPGGQLTIAWTAPGGRPSTDWVGLFVPGAQSEIWWTYTGGAASGSATLSAPGAGTYEARYLLEDGYQSTATSAPVTVGSNLPPVTTSADVVRFLEQSTFGPTPDLIAHVQNIGFEGFLNEQFNAPISSYPTLLADCLAAQRQVPGWERRIARRWRFHHSVAVSWRREPELAPAPVTTAPYV
jgi:hypothetical protein